MRKGGTAGVICTLLTALALTGCGNSDPAGSAGGSFQSSAVSGGKLPAEFTCDGKNIAPPLKWGKLPKSVLEFSLFALVEKTPNGATPAAFENQANGPSSNAPTILWSMAGLTPKTQSIAAGQIPPKAYLETASDGKRHYSVCPPKGQTTRIRFALYALPNGIYASPELGGPLLLHNLTEASRPDRSPYQREFTVTYTRG